MSKKVYIASGVVIAILILYFSFKSSDKEGIASIESFVKIGRFDIVVTVTGELLAEKSEKVLGPSGMRKVRVYNTKIVDMIPEGTVVKEGDYVATLDRTDITGKLKDAEAELQQLQLEYTKTKLDTAIDLRGARDNLSNLDYAIEEAKITLSQSKFEAPAVIRQATITLEKAERNFQHTLKNYELKVKQNNAIMEKVSVKLSKQQRKLDDILSILDKFVVKAPKDGMLIYQRGWDGAKKTVNSTISAWDPVIAILPDLTEMISKTYVNEIDVSKVKVGQNVEIGVDAFPKKQYHGKVMSIENIGQKRPGNLGKVFEVIIKFDDNDSILRPAMTTANTILIASYTNVLFVPLEALYNDDSLSYVFKKDGLGLVKQIVETGDANENEIIIKGGLLEGDIVLLSIPNNSEDVGFNDINKNFE